MKPGVAPGGVAVPVRAVASGDKHCDEPLLAGALVLFGADSDCCCAVVDAGVWTNDSG